MRAPQTWEEVADKVKVLRAATRELVKLPMRTWGSSAGAGEAGGLREIQGATGSTHRGGLQSGSLFGAGSEPTTPEDWNPGVH